MNVQPVSLGDKMANKVYITNEQKSVKIPSGIRLLIRRCCNAVLEVEEFPYPAEISVTLVDNERIKELNTQFRDKPTEMCSHFLSLKRVHGNRMNQDLLPSEI